MSTLSSSIFVKGAGIAALALLASAAYSAPTNTPNVPYGAPLPAPGQGGGPGGGGGGGFRGGFGGFAIGQIATVNGSSFTVTSTFDQSTVTIKIKPDTQIIKSTDATIDDIKVGDTLSVRGRPDADNNITPRSIADGTVGLAPAGGPRPAGGAPGAGAPGAGGGNGGGGGFRRMAPISGVVQSISPLTIKSADGTTYTLDTSNNPSVTMTTAGKIDDIVAGKYVQVQGAPPAGAAGGGGAPGTPIAPPTEITANQITVSDTQPQFGRGGGGGGRRNGGGGAGGAAVQ